jgi:hypothetical protein
MSNYFSCAGVVFPPEPGHGQGVLGARALLRGYLPMSSTATPAGIFTSKRVLSTGGLAR